MLNVELCASLLFYLLILILTRLFQGLGLSSIATTSFGNLVAVTTKGWCDFRVIEVSSFANHL